MRSWEEVHRLHDQENRSGREIARTLGMSRNTVSRLLALREPPRYQRSVGSRLDPYRADVIALLHCDPRMPTALVHQRLRERGYEGGTTAVKQFVATIRREASQRGASDNSPLVEPDSEPGMNLISVNFDIVMVNRVNERLFKKPMVELLGKKCYREFERREGVCPHCPGLAALTTGIPHQVETRGIRDDGTRYAVRLTAHPIVAPNGHPLGFVEVEEDITERKRSERLAELVENLHTSLAATHDVTAAVQQALNVAFSLEGVDFGSAYVWDRVTAGYRAVAQRGAARGLGRMLAEDVRMEDDGAAGSGVRKREPTGVRSVGRGPDPVELVPFVHEGVRVGALLLGSATYVEFPPATRAAFEALAEIVSAAIASLQALQLERETRTDLEGLLGSLPVPTWCTDDKGRITLWNRAAERVFGWSSTEVNESPIPREAEGMRSGDVALFSRKTGFPLRTDVTTVPAPRALGAKRRALHVASLVATPLTKGDRVAVADQGKPVEDLPTRGRQTRVLLFESERPLRLELAKILRDMNCRVHTCRTAAEVVERYMTAFRSKRPYHLVIFELLLTGGVGGLELASELRRADPQSRVMLTADAHIVGFESHGLAGVLQKPYEPDPVRREVMNVLLRIPDGTR